MGSTRTAKMTPTKPIRIDGETPSVGEYANLDFGRAAIVMFATFSSILALLVSVKGMVDESWKPVLIGMSGLLFGVALSLLLTGRRISHTKRS